MPGKICKIKSGIYEGKYIQVSNVQDQQLVAAGKVTGDLFEEIDKPLLLGNGKQKVGVIAVERLIVVGFYD